MKTSTKTLLKATGLAISAATSTQAYAAQNDTQWFIELRERAEHQENLNDKFYGDTPKVGSASDSYLLSRIRIGLDHRFSDQLSGRITLQDSRALGWGFENEDWVNKEFGGIENNPQHDPVELGETWLQYQSGMAKLKVGRQSIHYGNKRVFGPGAWKNSGKWVWDAAKLRLKKDKNWMDLFYGQTMLHDPETFSLEHHHGYTGGGLYGHIKATDSLIIEPMLIHKFNDESDSYQEKDLFYYGARAIWLYNGFKIDTTYLQQKGEISDNSDQKVDVDAYGYHFDLSYRYNPKWLLGSALAYGSGDNKSTADNERFDGAYGASDKYYGRMNLMAWSNLYDYHLWTNYRPHRDWEFNAEYHRFYADQLDDKWRAYKNGLNADSKHYGDEIDLIIKYRISKELKLQLGLGTFIPGAAIKQAVDNNQANLSDDQAYSGFLQLKYTFKASL